MSTTIDLGKLRFNWVGEWASNTLYESNDIIRHGGDVFVYIYALKTSGNVTTNATYWAKVQEGLSWKGEYDASNAYLPHEVVHHSNNAYVNILEEPTAGNAPPNATYWQLLATGINFEGAYNNSTAYQVDDIVYYGANTFICIANSAGGNLPTDTAYWGTFSHGLDWKGIYANATAYKKSDVVSYGANVYIAKVDTVSNLPTDTAKWDVLSSGIQWEGPWDIATSYQKDDVVSLGSNTFIARIDSVGDNPELVGASWEVLTPGIRSRGVWATATEYVTDDVVSYGGQAYIVLTSHASGTFATDLAANKWVKFTGGFDWKGIWTTSTGYKVNDIVNNGGSVYIATADHTSSTFAGDSAYWTTFANAGTDVGLTITSQGDLLYRNASGPAALSAGTDGQVLTTKGAAANPVWQTPASSGIATSLINS